MAKEGEREGNDREYVCMKCCPEGNGLGAGQFYRVPLATVPLFPAPLFAGGPRMITGGASLLTGGAPVPEAGAKGSFFATGRLFSAPVCF